MKSYRRKAIGFYTDKRIGKVRPITPRKRRLVNPRKVQYKIKEVEIEAKPKEEASKKELEKTKEDKVKEEVKKETDVSILKGQRLGQSNVSNVPREYIIKRESGEKEKITIPAGHYVKGGELVKYSKERDMAKIAEHKREKEEAPWRGDLPHSKV